MPPARLVTRRAGALAEAALVVSITLAALAGCRERPRDEAPPETAIPTAPVAKEAKADPAHGKALVESFQCNRCHAGTGGAAPPQNKDCVGCHASIIEGAFLEPAPATLRRWEARVRDYIHAPSLEAMGRRTTRGFVASYLLLPKDQRPHLAQSMPRLPLTPTEARDVAAYLVPDDDAPVDLRRAPELANADLGKGRALLETKGCGSCHAFTGVAALPPAAPPQMDGKVFVRGRALAPDLRTIRERTTPAKLVAWLRDPKGVKPDTAMPNIPMTETELRDVAGYLLTAELAPLAMKPLTARLPLLARKVTFKEVDEKVFHRTCWHCHSEPDYAIGDGGPGNSGGFGFKPRGLNLSDYAGVAAGFLDDHGERASIFVKDDGGVPRLVRALLARHDEENGAETGAVRGMPLGYPALPLEDIQLVDTWISQGRPR